MNILVAIDSFKGSISSITGGEAISLGIKEVYPDAEITQIPLADGGEGTVEALIHATEGHAVERVVSGPLGEKVTATYGISGDGKTAMIEVASACGLTLVPQNELDAMRTTTYGVGELINDAIEKGCRHFIIGLGGSATTDAGVGMLQALGYEFKNARNEEVGAGGVALHEIEEIITESANPRLVECTFHVASDVNNYLYGTNGAAYVFGPQKGATPEQVEALDEGLRHFAQKVREDLGLDIHAMEGAGAAGGLGAAFFGFLDAKLESGIELVLQYNEVEKYMEEVDVVVTGEGMLDGQTSMGKAPIGVAGLAKKHHVPVIALAGGINQEDFNLNELGMTSCFSILQAPMALEEAMNKDISFQNLKFTSSQLFRLIKAFQ